MADDTNDIVDMEKELGKLSPYDMYVINRIMGTGRHLINTLDTDDEGVTTCEHEHEPPKSYSKQDIKNTREKLRRIRWGLVRDA